ncbi:MAG TPA: DUF421 domain-containing protein [Saprospiraceae bacterium]|jgi:uncharacterized membrane protein YcaP (DUF421 family)|nr:DUF421 domain-containing protein [Saprospiraceae bacterium]MBX7179087.1 DUF421 domain-containing protein [Saprospiraceae bacterium]MCB0591167.1 DUF421 domain-containing protein [Saprospiraceae bacterium]MCO5284089.1 DUF421 domain-containing protein [Saprospiraceae bacterium]MCO6469667.1 DUF421 domain-containing protein [Saprospiraceae bacterium]
MGDFMSQPMVQIVLRCIAVYLFVVLALRIFGKTELAQLSVVDLVFILLISNSVQNAMVGPDTSLGGGLVAAFSLFTLNYGFKRLIAKNKKVSDLIQGKEILLAYNGKVHMANLKKAGLTESELNAAIREHGVQDISGVDLAMLEVDGNISVISDDYKKRASLPSPHKHKHKWKGGIN